MADERFSRWRGPAGGFILAVGVLGLIADLSGAESFFRRAIGDVGFLLDLALDGVLIVFGYRLLKTARRDRETD